MKSVRISNLFTHCMPLRGRSSNLEHSKNCKAVYSSGIDGMRQMYGYFELDRIFEEAQKLSQSDQAY
jgi:hypothetical protein